jgi:protease-4
VGVKIPWIGALAAGWSAVAAAQVTYESDPAAGLALPAAPLAGDHGATATVLNPAGLPFLGGAHLELAATGLRDDAVSGAGSGVGLYAAVPVEVPLLPRFGLGLAVEKLFPPDDLLAPDPGRPLRLSLGAAWSLGGTLGVGLAWHHFMGDGTAGAVDGLDALDVGLAARLGAHWAAGLVLRDALPGGGEPRERRYDAEVVSRPLGTDRLEIGVGAAVGERRGGLDARARLGVRLTDGLALRGGVELRTLFEIDAGGDERRVHELRASAGLEISFGGVGAAAYATMASGLGKTRLEGATVMARWSAERYPSLSSRGARIERVKLAGELGERTLTRALITLRRHERDRGVRAVFLQLDGLRAGWGTLEEVRDAVARLRKRGKKVYAYMSAGGTRDVYVAAACDKLFLDVGGGLRLVGLSSSSLYFRELFDKLGVTPQFEKIEEYKSAPEMFTMEGPSPEAAEQRAALLDDVYARVVAAIAAGRRLPEERVRRIFEEGPYTAAEALAAGIVDATVEPAELDRILIAELGEEVELGDGVVRERPASWRLPQIAVVYLDGDIVDGKSKEVPLLGQKVAGGETLAQALSWARENPRVRAVVLRVSSPGGSALASEHIAREGFRMRGKKPFVVSIGDVAASGGYFAAAAGDLIFAEPSSITGSIGIFTGKFDLSGLLARFGVTWNTSTRGTHADMESFLRPYTDEERALIKSKLRYFYGRFIGAVSKGRGMSEEEVDAVGRGRVWTGAQAMRHRLVDRHGGFIDALAEAKQRAGIPVDDPVELVMLPRAPASFVDRLLKLAGAEAEPAASALDTVPWGEVVKKLPASMLLEPAAVQARLPMVLIDD